MKVEYLTLDLRSMSAIQLYDILKLRQDVFMWEENIHYPDLDDVDKTASHVIATVAHNGNETLAAYARVYKDDAEHHVKIGRVVTATKYRGHNIASKVMKTAISVAQNRFNADEVWLDAQMHVVDFYKNLGFNVMSEPFIEAGIQHVSMAYKIEKECTV